MLQMRAQPAGFKAPRPLSGRIRVPGDKSISHRAVMLSALAIGTSRIDGLLEGEDVLATAAAMRALGAQIYREPVAGDDGGRALGADVEKQGGEKRGGRWIVDGVGVGGLLQPAQALDMGNSGTSTRLLMGLVAAHAISACFIGDASLSKRPMARVIEPLSRMGADFASSPGDRLPLMLRGLTPAIPIAYRLPVASAQVKSAVLLAGLNTPGVTRVIEPVATRDHSERMLKGFGAGIEIGEEDGARVIAIRGPAELRPQEIVVPGDPSSAAFPVVAALLVPGSDVLVENVGLNPTRAGLFEILRAMGGDISYEHPRTVGGEPVADIRVRHSRLRGIEVPPEIAPSMIDEFPILFVAAALATGRTVTRGLDELRVKESDRLALMARGLARLGVIVDESPDGLTIEGRDGAPFAGNGTVTIAAELDHRIAMSFAIAGLASGHDVAIDDMSPVATSFPGFADMLTTLGAERFEAVTA